MKMARNSKGGWLLYCMVHIPCVWRFKVGITSLNIGAKKRAANIDKAMFGFPLPIMVLPVPFAYAIEQEMHRIMRAWKTDFYRGDGHTEWMILAPLFFTVPIMLSVWGLYIAAFDAWAGTRILPTVAGWVFEMIYFLFF
jgi:hypothetical protein